MTPKKLSLIISFIVALSASGQTTFDTSKKTLFENGIYLENLNITLPWHFQLPDTASYGHPKVTRLSNRTFKVSWDSVQILNGIYINLFYYPVRIYFSGGKYFKLTNLFGTFDDSAFVKLMQAIDQYPAVTRYPDTENFAAYTFDNVRIRFWKNHKKLGNYLQMQLIE